MQADVVVIGAGVAGLTVASLLVRGGRKVLLLESSDRVGGLAGDLKVQDYVFPRAAAVTTGLEPDLPLGLLLEELWVSAPVLELHGETCLRLHGHAYPLDPEDSDPESRLLEPDWSQEQLAEALHPGLADFLIQASDFWPKAWQAVLNAPQPHGVWLDPQSLAQGHHGEEIAKALHQSASERFKEAGGSDEGVAILSGLLECLAGARAEETSFFQACLILERLWRPLFMPMGNLAAFCRKLGEYVNFEGGELRTNARVNAVKALIHDDQHSQEAAFVVETGGEEIFARQVVLNLPPPDAASILQGPAAGFFCELQAKAPQPLTMCSLYLVVDDVFHPDERMFHYCLLPKSKVLGEAKVLYLALLPSDLEEVSRPRGVRQLVAHVPVNPKDWIDLDPDERKARSGHMRLELMRVLQQSFPQLADARIIAAELHLPEDWNKELSRTDGSVLRPQPNPLSNSEGWLSGQTPTPGLFHVGACVFPGMTLVGAVESGRRVARHLLD